MQQRFLPNQKDGLAWGCVPESASPSYIPIENGAMGIIGDQMDVGIGDTEPFSPTPFSRALTFETVLLATGMTPQKARARQTFRGILSFLALRDLVGLTVNLGTCPLNWMGQGARSLREAFEASLTQIPGCELPPRTPANAEVLGAAEVEVLVRNATEQANANRDFWRRLPYLFVNNAKGETEPVCGLSPKTVVYPAAHAATALSVLYWYRLSTRTYEDTRARENNTEYMVGEWFDPTNRECARLRDDPAFRIQPSNVAMVQSVMLTWLGAVLDGMADEQMVQILYGCPIENVALLRMELGAWHDELTRANVMPLGTIAVKELAAEAQVSAVNLAVRYSLDIFTPRLVEVDKMSPLWRGAKVDANSEKSFLLPLKREFAKQFSIEYLCANTVITPQGNSGHQYVVTFTLNGQQYKKLYVGTRVEGQDAGLFDGISCTRGKLDVRIFPDFCLTGPGGGALTVQVPDREFYVRVRSNPFSSPVTVIAQDDRSKMVEGTPANPVTVNLWDPPPTPISQHFRVDAPFLPAGIYMEDCGFAFFTPMRVAFNPTVAESLAVAVDFGTANTCIVYRTSANGACEILRPPTMCSAMAASLGGYEMAYVQDTVAVSEYGRAILDFFSLFRGNEFEPLAYDANYFPSQFMTTRGNGAPRAPQAGLSLDLQNGLIYFQNVSHSTQIVGNEINSFPVENPRAARSFLLKDNVKWENKEWRRSFMVHLRKMIVLSAARRGAWVPSITFSYPRAFDSLELALFDTEVLSVWGAVKAAAHLPAAHGGGVVAAPVPVYGAPLEYYSITESAAMHSFFCQLNPNAEHVVLDVGGGTTDILAVNNLAARYQASVKLAAGQINEIVVRSLLFRKALRAAAYDKLSPQQNASYERHLDIAWNPLNRTENSYMRLAWFGLLKELGEDYTGKWVPSSLKLKMSAHPSQQDAVAKFYWAVTVLFTSLSFFAGRMFRASLRRRPELGMRAVIQIHLAGNGAKLFDFIKQEGNDGAALLMAEMFKAGLGGQEAVQIVFSGIPRIGRNLCPKELVAWGAIESARQAVPIENGYFAEDIEKFAAATAAELDPATRVPFERLPMVDEYFSALSAAVVNGRYRNNSMIVPYVGPANGPTLARLYEDRNVWDDVTVRVKASGRKYQNDMAQRDEDAACASEPRFISHIISLLAIGIAPQMPEQVAENAAQQ